VTFVTSIVLYVKSYLYLGSLKKRYVGGPWGVGSLEMGVWPTGVVDGPMNLGWVYGS
jgi:hypothetical protein